MLNIKRRERRINYGDGEKNFIQRLLSNKGGRIIFFSGVFIAVLMFVYISAPTNTRATPPTTLSTTSATPSQRPTPPRSLQR